MAITLDDPEAMMARIDQARREVHRTLWRDPVPSPALSRCVVLLREVLDDLYALRDREGRQP